MNHSHCDYGSFRLKRRIQNYYGRTLLFACMTGFISSAVAAENEQSEEAPDLEFLEFLGQFETDAGEWIDPDSLLTEEFTELLEASNESDPSGNDDASDDNQ